MATGFVSFRRPTALVPFALLILAACSSKNTDSLIGMNLDENAAMTDANASIDANLAGSSSIASSGAAGNASSEPQANEGSAVSASVAKRSEPPTPSHSTEVTAVRNSTANSTQVNDVDNQAPDEPDVPNISSNDFD